MEEKKLEIISQLMEELQDLMGPSEGDFSERLGKVKPEMEVKVESEGFGGDEGMDEDEYCDSPDDKLKSRILKLRG